MTSLPEYRPLLYKWFLKFAIKGMTSLRDINGPGCCFEYPVPRKWMRWFVQDIDERKWNVSFTPSLVKKNVMVVSFHDAT